MWILALWANPLARKIALYAAVSLAIFFAVRWYSNRAYYQGMEQGRRAATTEIEKAKREEWKAESDRLAAEAAAIEGTRRTVGAEMAELRRSRAAMQTALSSSLKLITSTREVDNAQVLAVPDVDLLRAVRALSAELARTAPPAR